MGRIRKGVVRRIMDAQLAYDRAFNELRAARRGSTNEEDIEGRRLGHELWSVELRQRIRDNAERRKARP